MPLCASMCVHVYPGVHKVGTMKCMSFSGNYSRQTILISSIIAASVLHMFLFIKYPKFTYRADVEDHWQLTYSGYYTINKNISDKSLLTANNSTHLPRCSLTPPGIGSRDRVDLSITPSMDHILNQNPQVQTGGSWQPSNCTAQQKVAVIVTYKDRWLHLRHLLANLHPLLQKQQAHYRIYVAEQITPGAFNKGRVYNAGFESAMKQQNWDCVILHDVDLIPETDNNLYRCADCPIHLSAGVDTLRYTLMYRELVGGVLAMTPHQYRTANGFSNSFWGWGGEDDDMAERIEKSGMSILHTSTQNGRFKMVSHPKRKPSEHRFQYMSTKYDWTIDGLNKMDDLDLEVTAITNHHLYTNISVDVGQALEYRKFT